MSNQTTDPTPWTSSSSFQFTDTSSSSSSSSSIMNSSSTPPSPLLDVISANDIVSRSNYVFSFVAALGFLSGCFLLFSFVQTFRAQRRLAWLDLLLWVFCGIQILLLLLSLHIVAYRPKFLLTSALGCAALSFLVNVASLCGLLVLLLMAYVLTLDPPSQALLRKPSVCSVIVILTSVLVSLLLAGLHGPHTDLNVEGECFLARVGVLYAAARLCLAFLTPYILQVALLMCGCVRQWRSKGRFLSGSEEGPVFLSITAVMFLCLLFYSVSILRAAHLQEEEQKQLNHHERVFLSVAEFVFFSGSSVTLLLVLFMHRPSRESLYGVVRQVRDCCRNPGRTQPNRNIIAPHIEITDTLQDIES